MKYSKTKKINSRETHFGIEINDEYSWLENQNSEDTKNWINEQNKITQEYLSKIEFRDKIKIRLREILNFPKNSLPFFKGKNKFYLKNKGLQNQSVLYKNDEEFLNPNKFSAEGTISVVDYSFSHDNKYLAYTIEENGSDWEKIRIKNVETSEEFEETLEWVKAVTIGWIEDGFFYGRFPEPKRGEEYSDQNAANKIYFHKLGTPQSEDELIYENKEKKYREHRVFTNKEKTHLIITIPEGSSGDDFIIYNLKTKKFSKKIIGNFENHHEFLLDDGRILMKTNDSAPMYRIVEIDLDNPQKENWREIIPQREVVLEDVKITKSGIITEYLRDVKSELYLDDKKIDLPGPGALGGITYDRENNTLYYLFVSYSTPPTIFKYDLESNKREVYLESEVKFKRDDYITKQKFYTSKDGTQIPIFITHKKNIELNSINPTLLYGYGGFNVVLQPHFRATLIPFLEKGGVYAVANIRGGGEYGTKWHNEGKLLNKQNCFDDFIFAAEYLIKEKYTSPNKLAIEGGSNGGLLVAACMTQRPELFKVVLPAVGVLDMIKYPRFTDGEDWITDYGDPREKEHFKNLLSYSPYHNLKSVNYPAVLVTTGDHDDRVVPAHSYKFISKLQELGTGKNPYLIRIDTNAGHGGGKPLSKVIDEVADELTFLFYNLGINL